MGCFYFVCSILFTMNPKQYFKIQFDFASKMAALKNIELSHSLFLYTTFYRRLGIKGKHDETNSTWQDYVKGVREGKDPLDLFYSLYTEYRGSKDAVEEDRPYGAFKYDIENEVMYIHFTPLPDKSIGSLKKENMPERIAELTAMFKYVKEYEPSAKIVKGSSWIYNLDSYRRLVPLEYTKETIINTDCFQGSSGWGQFFKSDGEMNQERIAEFYKNLENLDPEHPYKVFPFQVFKVSAPIEAFYDFYGLTEK